MTDTIITPPLTPEDSDDVLSADSADQLVRGAAQLLVEAGTDLEVAQHALGRLRGDIAEAEAARTPTRLERIESQVKDLASILGQMASNIERIADATQALVSKQSALEIHCAHMHGPTAVKG